MAQKIGVGSPLGATSIPDWCNPLVAGRNKEAPHATLVPFADVESARAAWGDAILDWDRSPFMLRLDGQWRFFWSPSPNTLPENFTAVAFDDCAWDTIPVPSNWQMLGEQFVRGKPKYDVPIYTNIRYPFPIDKLPAV